MNFLEDRLIIKKLSEKYNLTSSEIEEIVKSLFLFMRDKIKDEYNPEQDSYPSFRILNFGRFFIPTKMQKHIKEKTIKSKKDESV